MSVVVFTGPTITADEARAELDAIYLPPVSQGDVYRAAAKGPRAIAIIDGYFERVPSVWHKEILWAMSRGIHVFGSSSMGALRAAELHQFGMVGVGAVFEAFRDGVLEDDDEVAVAHGPAETGFRVSSDAMVNIRATLDAATRAAILRPSTRDALAGIAKALFYPERVFPAILAAGLEQGLAANEIAALRTFLPTGRVNQKREDALRLLTMLRGLAEVGFPPKTVDFTFETTEFWCRAQRAAGELHASRRDGPACETVTFDRIVDELRLDPRAYRSASDRSMLRHLALMEADRRGITVDGDVLERVSDAFRRDRGLYQPDDVQAWMAEFHLGWNEYTNLICDEARIDAAKTALAEVSFGRLRDELTASGDYAWLLERARAKQKVFDEAGLSNPDLNATGMTEVELARWYFENCVGTSAPVDIARALRAAGFADAEDFKRVALREYAFRRSAREVAPGPV